MPDEKSSPLIPMNCSAEILDAINEAPIAHQVSVPSARKNALASCSLFFFFYKSNNHSRYNNKINNENHVVFEDKLIIHVWFKHVGECKL